MVRADCIQRHIQKSVMLSPRQRKLTQKYHSYSVQGSPNSLTKTPLNFLLYLGQNLGTVWLEQWTRGRCGRHFQKSLLTLSLDILLEIASAVGRRRGRASIGASASKTLYENQKQRTTKHPKPQRFGTLRHITKRKVPTTILTRYRVKSS